MVNDPIADLITQIRNASAVGKESITVPYSKLKHAVAQKLEDSGFVGAVTKRGKKARKCLEVNLRYEKEGESYIRGVKRVSKPGRRVYIPVSEINRGNARKESLILSTPKGILTGEEARKEHVGGEALFNIW